MENCTYSVVVGFHVLYIANLYYVPWILGELCILWGGDSQVGLSREKKNAQARPVETGT
jgi:hypothetical protein